MADRDTRHMAVNELRLAHKSSQGEHLIRFVDAFFDEGKILIAMEFADGGSMDDAIQRGQAPTLSLTLTLTLTPTPTPNQIAYVALIFALSLSFPVMFMVARTHRTLTLTLTLTLTSSLSLIPTQSPHPTPSPGLTRWHAPTSTP